MMAHIAHILIHGFTFCRVFWPEIQKRGGGDLWVSFHDAGTDENKELLHRKGYTYCSECLHNFQLWKATAKKS